MLVSHYELGMKNYVLLHKTSCTNLDPAEKGM